MATFVEKGTFAISDDEFGMIYKALQNEEFRENLRNFASEISDPENLNHYESEVKKFERERGVEVTFLHVHPGIALQVCNVDKEISFINVTSADEIEEPEFTHDNKTSGGNGIKWRVPLAVQHPRFEIDLGEGFDNWLEEGKGADFGLTNNSHLISKIRKEGVWIYEVIVSPVCFALARRSKSLENHLIKTVLETIHEKLKKELTCESLLGYELYIGNKALSKVSKISDGILYKEFNSNLEVLKDESSLQIKDDNLNSQNKVENVSLQGNKCGFKPECIKDIGEDSSVKPSYKLKHVNHVSLQDYSIVKNDGPQSLRPQALVLEVELPGVSSASLIDVDILGKQLELKTEKDPRYALMLSLPYEVSEVPKKAQFDLPSSILKIEMEVKSVNIGSEMIAECKNKFCTNEKDNINSFPVFIDDEPKDLPESTQMEDFLHPDYQLSQSEECLFINCNVKNLNCQAIYLNILNSDNFSFYYETLEDENKRISKYKEIISVNPKCFKQNGVKYQIKNDNLLIQIEKYEPEVWHQITTTARVINLLDNNGNIDCNNSINNKTASDSEIKSKDCSLYMKNGSSNDDKRYSSMLSAETSDDIETFFKEPLLPHCIFSQTYDFVFINIDCKNVCIKNVVIEPIDSKNFKFHYKRIGNGYVPLFYGAFINTAPYTFKVNGITHHFLEDALLIQVEKKKPLVWRKIRIGLEKKKLKEIKIKLKRNSKRNDKEEKKQVSDSEIDKILSQGTKSENAAYEDSVNVTNKEFCDGNEDVKGRRSSEVEIPQPIRRATDYFVTSSWPRGILKSRSRSLSDSQMESHVESSIGNYNVFGSSLECEDDVIEDEDKNDVDMSDDGILGNSSSPKKSVRFNDYVFKQVFRANSSILGQRAKNQKKAQQKKRARERKLSEGSQSSETETVTEHSDLVTTTEDDSNTDAEIVKGDNSKVNKKAKSPRDRSNKKKEKCNKKNKKNKKPVLNLSNDMVFQLDDA